MLTVVTICLGMSLIVLFGYKLSKMLLPNSDRLEQVALGYILGTGLFTFLWFLLNWIGISYSLISGFCLLVFLNTVLLFVERLTVKHRKISIIEISYFYRLNVIEMVLLGVFFFLCISTLIQNVYWPIHHWDSLTLYDFRAHLFVKSGSMQEAIAVNSFFGYPLLTSLAHTWVYLLGGNNPSFIYGLLYISFLVVFFFIIKNMDIGRMSTIFLTVLIAVSPRLFDHAQWAYTNLPYSIYITLGSVYLYFGIKNKDIKTYITSAFLVGLSTWARSTEPFWLSCLVIAVIAPFFQKRWFWAFLYSSILVFIMLPWRYFQSNYGVGTVNVASQIISTSNTVVRNIFDFSIFKTVLDYIAANVIRAYLGYFVIFTIILAGKFYEKSKEWIFIFLILLDLGIVFGGTLVFATSFKYWHEIPDSLTRMVMFIPPMVIFLCVEFIVELKNKNEGH